MNHIIQSFLDEGFITKEAASRLEEFEDFIKEAGFLDTLKDNVVAIAKKVGPHAVGTAIGAFGADYLMTRAMEKTKEEELRRMQASFATILQQDKDLSQNRERAMHRFNEIAHFSPSIASIPNIAHKVLKRTMDKGLDEKDIANLVQIEVGNRQVNRSVKHPTMGSRLFEKLAPEIVTSIGTGVSEAMTPEARAESKMQPMGGPRRAEQVKKILTFLKSRGLIPSQYAHLDFNSEEGLTEFIPYIQQNPGFLNEVIAKNNLVDEYNQIIKTATIKTASVNRSMSEEKLAEVLSDLYFLTKEAKVNIKGPALGLAAAGLVGLVGGLMQEGGDFARTRKMNEAIHSSWQETSGKLKKLTTEGSPLTGTIDYKDKEVQRKAEEAFKVLADISPSLAANSTIAASFVNNIVQNEGVITPDVVKMLSETQKNINTSREYKSPFASNPLMQGFGAGFTTAGGREFLRTMAQNAGDV